jgi:uncharacterized protein (TIGR01777 family)
MRVVIIGGSGLIGSALSQELQTRGHTVTILTRDQDHPSSAGEIWKHWNGREAEDLRYFIEGQDAVVNLAGASIGSGRWTKKQKSLILSSRVNTGQALAKAISRANEKPKIVIQASAIGFYGTGDEVKDENSPHGSDWLSYVCSEWERSIFDIRDFPVRLVIIRSGVVLARNGGVLEQMALPLRLFLGGPIGKGRQWISWIHLTDEVRAIRFLMEQSNCEGVYNLTAPEPVTNLEFGKTLARVMHRPFWLIVPALLLKLVLGEMSTLVLEGQQVLPARLIEQDFKFKFSNLEPALKELI